MYSAITSAEPTFPFEAVAPSFNAHQQSALSDRASGARMINSVVNDAGLGRFVYLLGKSGKRYVFSSITAEQATLYDKAVFASSKAGSDIVSVSPCAQEAGGAGHVLFVHLLDNKNEEPQTILEDLEQMNDL